MALTSTITKQLTAPHEPDLHVTIRKLSHHQLMMAEDARQDRVLEKVGRLGDAAKVIREATRDSTPSEDAEKPENKYDRSTVLRYGLTDWSYTEPRTPETIDDLDEATAAWLFAEIIAFSVRAAHEVKASASASQPTTDPDEVAGLPS